MPVTVFFLGNYVETAATSIKENLRNVLLPRIYFTVQMLLRIWDPDT